MLNKNHNQLLQEFKELDQKIFGPPEKRVYFVIWSPENNKDHFRHNQLFQYLYPQYRDGSYVPPQPKPEL